MSAFDRGRWTTPDTVCAGCGKRARGRTPPDWLDAVTRNRETKEVEEIRAVCGQACMWTWFERETKVVDATKQEQNLLRKAGGAGGEYLESIGKFSLETLSQGEWLTFLQAVVGTYMAYRLEEDDVPF